MATLTPDLRSREVDEGYSDLEKAIKGRLEAQKGPLFTTDRADRLFGLYLSFLPQPARQHYNCRCCGNFIERFGGLVTLTTTGFMESAVWPADVPVFFHEAVTNIRKELFGGQVNGVFLAEEEILGVPLSPKGWTHLHAQNPKRFSSKLVTASQRAAELKEDNGLVWRTISEYSRDIVTNAVRVLNSGFVQGEEKGKKIAAWYLQLLTDLDTTKDTRRKKNMVWAAVASAPPGFSHLKNGMVGTLLDDLKSGKTFEDLKESWEKKMHPAIYRRPTAAITDGQIEAAEKTVEKLGIARSLERRFATADELKHVIWAAKKDEPVVPLGGVFHSLKQKNADAPPITLPNQVVTWAKFLRDILPNMHTCEINLPTHGSFMGMTSAVHADAPPILQWDKEGDRNPTAFYVYIEGSLAKQWRVNSGWNTVDRICYPPHGSVESNHLKFVFFNIEAMMDVRGNASGSALFPSTLKSELKIIEKVIEKYSNANHLTGTGNANGYPFTGKASVVLKVNGDSFYTLDRWE